MAVVPQGEAVLEEIPTACLRSLGIAWALVRARCHGETGTVLLCEDHFNKELATPRRKQTISTSAWVVSIFSRILLSGLNK